MEPNNPVNALPLRGGVLIVGSLLWDPGRDDRRTEWRARSLVLKCEGMRLVQAPIRYGRKSGEDRHHTYTMVIWAPPADLPAPLGQAWAVEFKHPIVDWQTFLAEAKALWYAEGGAKGAVQAAKSHWGTVALLPNPTTKSPLLDSIRRKWQAEIDRPVVESIVDAYPPETAPISADGLLTLPWPSLSQTGANLSNFDFLLATVTKPDLNDGKFPDGHHIAAYMNRAQYFDYFDRNRDHLIFTPDDDEILGLLVRSSIGGAEKAGPQKD